MTAALATVDQPEPEPEDVPPLVDWEVAVATARRLARPGPAVTAQEARDVVADLRDRAALAEAHVENFTGLAAPSGAAPIVVVDRPGWVRANASAFGQVLDPLARIVAEKRKEGSGKGAGMSARLAGIEAGALLAYMSSRVLGQFDPFFDADGAYGRLLLVAPNVLHIERELDANPADFRLWVCLHEETHRVQFTAVPWLRDHLRDEIGRFVAETDVDPSALADRLREGLGAVVGSLRGQSDTSLVEVVQTPAQRAILDRMIGLMSLLEGHADYVMDGVGPDVVPTVADIRKKFTKRRAGSGSLDQMVRRLLGIELKMQQYREGATFVRYVVDAVGRDGFNRVWTSADTLPSRAEIGDPDAWLRRVAPTSD